MPGVIAAIIVVMIIVVVIVIVGTIIIVIADAGRSRLSALAVFRLTTSSYLVGVRTGRSAGFDPLRMRIASRCPNRQYRIQFDNAQRSARSSLSLISWQGRSRAGEASRANTS